MSSRHKENFPELYNLNPYKELQKALDIWSSRIHPSGLSNLLRFICKGNQSTTMCLLDYVVFFEIC